MTPPLLTVSGLRMAFGPVTVLSDIHLTLQRGEIHALVGENGAGKSTLSRIIAGLLSPVAGTMALRGQPYSPRTKREAERQGVRMVLQELNLIGTLTVAENLFLEDLPQRLGWIDRPELARRAREALARVGLAEVDPGRLAGDLGVGQQQMVEIAAGIYQRCDLLILDEPTASLTDPEIERLFARLMELKAAGTTVLYISHRMEEIRRLADRISVLRDGRLIETRPVAEFPLPDIVRVMVGRELEEAAERPPRRRGPVALRVRNLRRDPVVHDVSFDVHQGEILGIAGLMGSGRTETVRAVFGADQPDAGHVYLADSRRSAVIRSPRDAVRQGLALVTEDRKEQGLLLPLSVRLNITLPNLTRLATRGWLRGPAERAEAEKWHRTLGVRCRDSEQPVGELSGGNQQKIVIAKWLARDCDVLIFDEPTRGIDVGARFEIYQLLDDLAARGKALVVVSSDLRELMSIADRIAVMSAGRIAAVFDRGGWSQDDIMAAALSGYLDKKTSQPMTAQAKT
jgi:ribose transport system ATP-binding protein